MSLDNWIEINLNLEDIPDVYLEILDRDTKKYNCTLEQLIVKIVTEYVEEKEE